MKVKLSEMMCPICETKGEIKERYIVERAEVSDGVYDISLVDGEIEHEGYETDDEYEDDMVYVSHGSYNSHYCYGCNSEVDEDEMIETSKKDIMMLALAGIK